LGVLEAWQLNDDAVRAEHLNLGLCDAIGVDAPRDDVEDALHRCALLVGRHLAEVSLQRQLGTALQVEAELGPLSYEVADMKARVAGQHVAARNVVAWLLGPDDKARNRGQEQDEDQTFHTCVGTRKSTERSAT